MVKAVAARPPSRDRLLAAAGAEFAARGFDGAKVDRIAVRARVNKAMLYYHFGSKAALYRTILHDMFAGVAAAVADVRRRGGPPQAQIRGFIEAIVREAGARPHFPPIWLREMAEGGRHLDARTVDDIRAVLDVLAAILADGRRAGTFGDVHPLIAQIGIVAPIMFFAASAPLRERFAHLVPHGGALPPPEAVTEHVLATTLAAIAAPAVPPRRVRR